MGDAYQFLWALVDAAKAAMIGLNPVPVIVISLLIGLGQAKRTAYFIKALVALVPGIIIMSLWPQIYGMSPIWPDAMQMEGQMQIATLFIIAYVMIRTLCLVKNTIALTGNGKPGGPRRLMLNDLDESQAHFN